MKGAENLFCKVKSNQDKAEIIKDWAEKVLKG
jgi:hypothetical protein